MKKLIISILITLCLSTAAYAPAFTRGVVFDVETRAPLKDVFIFVYVDTNTRPKVLKTRTDSLGRYKIGLIEETYGPIFLLRKFGYYTKFWRCPVELRNNLRIDFEMRKRPLYLKDTT